MKFEKSARPKKKHLLNKKIENRKKTEKASSKTQGRVRNFRSKF
jgi:hypothetical protein